MILAAIGAMLMALSLALSTTLCGLTRAWAPRLGLVDRPGGHKAHRAPTPLGGGVAIWATMALVLAAGALVVIQGGQDLPAGLAAHVGGLRERGGELAGIFALATLVMAMGLADDAVGLGWKPRLAVQIALATVLVVAGIRVTLFWPFAHPVFTWPLSILWIVGLTNAFNFLDNMDGLAGGVGLIAALLLAGAQVAVGGLFVPAVLSVLAGALAGFLVHNRSPARLFMGDAGSNFLGFLLGALTIAGTFTRTQRGDSPYGVLTPLLVMAVPLYDTATVILIRIRQGRSPFQGDRCHFSHRLVERGLTPRWAVRTIDLVTLAGGLGALLLPRLGPFGAGVVVVQTICLLGVVAILEISTTPERRNGEAQRADAPAADPRVLPDAGRRAGAV